MVSEAEERGDGGQGGEDELGGRASIPVFPVLLISFLFFVFRFSFFFWLWWWCRSR